MSGKNEFCREINERREKNPDFEGKKPWKLGNDFGLTKSLKKDNSIVKSTKK